MEDFGIPANAHNRVVAGEEYLVWTKDYHLIDESDQDDIDDFNECLESRFDDEDMVYGYYPFGGDKNSLEFHIKEVEMFNE